MTLIAELKRRNVFKVAVAYLIVAWLSIQVLDVLVQLMGLPEWIARAMVLILVVTFPVALVLAWAFELTPQGIKREHEVNRSESITDVTGRKLDFVIIAFLLIALGFFAFDKFVLVTESGYSNSVAIDEFQDKKGNIQQQTVAVVPFIDTSQNTSSDWIGEAIATEMQTELSKRTDLQVLSRSSSFAIPDNLRSSQDIGRALGVDVLVEGTIRQIGDRIRVTVQLVSVVDGYQLWSDVYEARLSNDFSVEIAIAEFFSTQVRNQLAEPFKPNVQLTEFSKKSSSWFSSKLGVTQFSSSLVDTDIDPILDSVDALDSGNGESNEE